MANTPVVRDEKTLEISPVIAPDSTLASVTDKMSGIVLRRTTTLGWILGFAIFFLLLQGLLVGGVTYLLFKGVGIWGLNIPIGWGFAIVNFVWWIGIGHAGTLISAILLLAEPELAQLDQPLRGSDDALCRDAAPVCSLSSTWGARGWLLAFSVPQYDGDLASVPQPVWLGTCSRFQRTLPFRWFSGMWV